MSSGPLALTPEIEALRRQFEAISAEGEALVAPLSDEQFYWKRSDHSWSIAQCLDHLNVAARLSLPRLDAGIAHAIRAGQYGQGPFVFGWLGGLMTRMTEPPPRWRVKSSPTLQPPPHRARKEVTAAFRAYQVQYIDRLRQANGLDLARARVRSPIGGWMRFSLGAAFTMTAAHERRHLWQARQVTTAPGFPRV